MRGTFRWRGSRRLANVRGVVRVEPQSRCRAVSVSGETYAKLTAYAMAQGVPTMAVVDAMFAELWVRKRRA